MRRICTRWLAVSAILLGPLGTARSAEVPASDAAAEVDRLLAQEVFASPAEVHLAPPANDEIYLRRVYLDLVGEIPGPNEICQFVLDPSPNKRAEFVARLLDDPRYGRNWGRYWRDVISYRRSAGEGAQFGIATLETYLADSFNANRPWAEVARAFVEAKGEVLTNGQAGLFVAQLAEPTDVASEMSRIFLGVQIQCAQCHDHPTDRWKREQFHQFAAFFPRVGLRRAANAGRAGIEVASFDNGPETRRPGMFGSAAKEHYMPDLKDPSSRGTLMTPVFFATGQKLATGATDDERRHSLAEWMTSQENPWFSKAVVNRLWAELVGEGFYEPIDDLGPDRKCSAPQTIDYLADQFTAHGHDLKWLLETILGTAAYQRESRPRRLPDEAPFAANAPHRLRSDQLYDVLTAVMGYDPDEALIRSQQPQPAGRLPPGVRAQFAAVFGYDPSTRRDEITTSIPQALMLMNSQQVNRTLTARQEGTMLGQLLATTRDNEQATIELYLRCLARTPNAQEVAACLDHIRASASREDAFEDIHWSLVNSKEFMYRR